MTMDAEGWATDLIAITGRLVELMNREIEMLRAMRPRDIEALQEEKAALARLYEQQVAALRDDPRRLTVLEPILQQELRATTDAYDSAIRRNAQALRAARDANEALLKAIVDAANALRKEGYSETGGKARASRGNRPPTSLAVDRTL
jgi:hypothetical protein